MRGPRRADTLRLALGVVLMARPGTALRWTGSQDGERVREVVRILGARYVLQSAAGLAIRSRWLRVADSTVDLVHAASMAALARELPAHRRAAVLSGSLALTFAALDLTEQSR